MLHNLHAILVFYCCVKKNTHISSHRFHQKSGQMKLGSLLRVLTGRNQGFSQAWLFLKDSGEGSASNFIQVIGQIQFLLCGCKSEFPISLLTHSCRQCSLLLETFWISSCRVPSSHQSSKPAIGCQACLMLQISLTDFSCHQKGKTLLWQSWCA